MKTGSVQIVVVALALATLAGCGKKDDEAPASITPPAAAKPSGNPSASAPVAPSVAQEYVASPAMAPGGHCFLDAINGVAPKGATAKIGQEVSFGGWVADMNNKVPEVALFVLEGAKKSYSIPLVAGGDRPDVAAVLANEALKSSGFNVVAKLDAVVPGDYALAIVLGSDKTARCELNAKLTVSN